MSVQPVEVVIHALNLEFLLEYKKNNTLLLHWSSYYILSSDLLVIFVIGIRTHYWCVSFHCHLKILVSLGKSNLTNAFNTFNAKFGVYRNPPVCTSVCSHILWEHLLLNHLMDFKETYHGYKTQCVDLLVGMKLSWPFPKKYYPWGAGLSFLSFTHNMSCFIFLPK